MREKDDLSTKELAPVSLTAFNQVAKIHNHAASKALRKMKGVLPRCAFGKSIVSMAIAKELANNPELTAVEVVTNVSENLAISYGVHKTLHFLKPGNCYSLGFMAFDIAADVGERIDLEQYNRAVSNYLSLVKPCENVSEDLTDNMLNQLERMETASFVPYALKGASICRDQLREWANGFVNLFSETLADVKSTLHAQSEQFQMILQQSGIMPPEDKGKNTATQAPNNTFEIFQELLANALDEVSVDVTSRLSNSLPALLNAEDTIKSLVADYQRQLEKTKDTANTTQSQKSKLKALSPEYIRIGASLAQFIYLRDHLRRNDRKFKDDKKNIIKNMELAIQETRLEMDESRIQCYTHNNTLRSNSLGELRQQVYGLIREDIALNICMREKKLERIQLEIIEIKACISALSQEKEKSKYCLQSLILKQMQIQDKINDVYYKKIPHEIQAGLPLLTNLLPADFSVVGMALSITAFGIDWYNNKRQEKAQRKITNLQTRFNDYQYSAEIIKTNLKHLDYRVQSNLADKARLNLEKINTSYGTPQLIEIKSTITENQRELDDLGKSYQVLLTQQQNLEARKKNSEKELQTTTSNKKSKKLVANIQEINTELALLSPNILEAQLKLKDSEKDLKDLEAFLEQQKPIANLLDWFDSYHASFYKGLSKDELAARSLWQKTVIEQLGKAKALNSKLDASVSGLSRELLAFVPLFQHLHLPRVAKYFERSIQTLQLSYKMYQTSHEIYLAFRVLNKARFAPTGDDLSLTSTMSIIGAFRKMGLDFSLENVFIPALGIVNLTTRLLDTVFGWNLFKDPIQVLIEKVARQLHEEISQLSGKVSRLSQQEDEHFLRVNGGINALKSLQAEDYEALINIKSQVKRLLAASARAETENWKNDTLAKFRIIRQTIQKIEQSRYKQSPKNRYASNQLIATSNACSDDANKVVMPNGLVINPLDATQYIRELLDFSEDKTELPNYYILCSILESLCQSIQGDESESDMLRITKITSLAEELNQFFVTLSEDPAWLKKRYQILNQDLKTLNTYLDSFKNMNASTDAIHITNNETAAKDYRLVAQQKWLNKWSNLVEKYKLYYHPGNNKNTPPKTVAAHSIMITGLIDSPPGIRVAYTDNAQKFITPTCPDGTNLFRTVVPVTQIELELVRKIITGKKNKLIEGFSHLPQFQQLLDRLSSRQNAFLGQYRLLLKYLFQSGVYLPNRSCFELPTQQQKIILSQLLPAKLPQSDELAQTLDGIPTVLIFNATNEYLSLLLPKPLIDSLDADPANSDLAEMASLGLAQRKIEYIFKKRGNTYFFSLLYQFKDNFIEHELCEFDSESVESCEVASPDAFIIHKLYGGVLEKTKHYKDANPGERDYCINLFKFFAKYPTLRFTYNSARFSPMLETALRDMIEKGVTTNTLLPFFQPRSTHYRSDNWLIMATLLSEMRSNRLLQLKDDFENRKGSSARDLVLRIVKNYELLIAGIRIFSNMNYSTAVTVVKEQLHLPHLGQVESLWRENIAALQNLLQEISRQYKEQNDSLFVNLIAEIRTLTDGANVHHTRLLSLLNRIKAKMGNRESDANLANYPMHSQALNKEKETAEIITYREALISKESRINYPLQKSLLDLAKTSDKKNEQSVLATLTPKAVFFNDSKNTDEKHHYNFAEMQRNIRAIQPWSFLFFRKRIACCLRKDIHIKIKELIPIEGVYLFAVLNHFHWSLLALHIDKKGAKTYLWKDNYTQSEPDKDEFNATPIKANSKLNLQGKMHDTGPVVLQEIKDILFVISIFGEKFSLDKLFFSLTDSMTEADYLKAIQNIRLNTKQLGLEQKKITKVNDAMNLLLSAYYQGFLKEVCNPESNISLDFLQMFADNLLRLLWEGASYTQRETYQLAHTQTMKPAMKGKQPIYPQCQFRVIAKQLAQSYPTLFYQQAPLSAKFFKTYPLQAGAVATVLRNKAIEYIKNNPLVIFGKESDPQQALESWLAKTDENFSGDEKTLLALSQVLGLSIQVVYKNNTDNWQIEMYSNENVNQKQMVLTRDATNRYETHSNPVSSFGYRY